MLLLEFYIVIYLVSNYFLYVAILVLKYTIKAARKKPWIILPGGIY
jgi:hypothetical protein